MSTNDQQVREDAQRLLDAIKRQADAHGDSLSPYVAAAYGKLRRTLAGPQSTFPPPTHPRAGSSKERQEIGRPGHCERCAEVGHVKAHRSLGCGDVGCTSPHRENDPRDA